MRIELNHKEYTSELYALKYLIKCDYCAWKPLPVQYCTKFCCKGHVFADATVKPSIFHL